MSTPEMVAQVGEKRNTHMEHVTRFYWVNGEVDCELKCSCGEIVGGMGRTQHEAHEQARAMWYEHLHMVKANKAETPAARLTRLTRESKEAF